MATVLQRQPRRGRPLLAPSSGSGSWDEKEQTPRLLHETGGLLGFRAASPEQIHPPGPPDRAAGILVQDDPAGYESLAENGSRAGDLLVRGGTVVVPGMEPYRADVMIEFGDPLELRGGRVVEVGDLADVAARDTVDAAGLFLHPGPEVLAEATPGRAALMVDRPASFVLRRSRDPAGEAVWQVSADGDLRTARD